MLLREWGKTATLVLLFITFAVLASCGGGKRTPTVSSSALEPVTKIVSTTFSSGIVDDTTSDDVGMYSSIAIDPDDNYPAIAYYDSSGANLMYAKWDGSDWDDKATVDSSGDVGQYASLA
jgi:hypothetical protein